MHKDYFREFNSDWPEPLSHHNVLKELPVSYWTDGVAKGLSLLSQRDLRSDFMSLLVPSWQMRLRNQIAVIDNLRKIDEKFIHNQ